MDKYNLCYKILMLRMNLRQILNSSVYAALALAVGFFPARANGAVEHAPPTDAASTGTRDTNASLSLLFPQLAIAPINRADRVDIFVFPPVDEPPLDRTIAANTPRHISQLSRKSQRRLVLLVLRRESYASAPGIVSSCVFYPTLGFRFRSAKYGDLWFLVSETCRLGLFASIFDDWRQAQNQILGKAAAKELEELAGRIGR